MKITGALNKMATMHDEPVHYALAVGDDFLAMNKLIGKRFSFSFTHKHLCACGEIKDKVYRNNLCYECYLTDPRAGDAIFRPELSKAHLGIEDRDLEFEKAYQLQPHVVYLAVSGGFKVGVTRARQQETRWMDQGASRTIVLAETPNRYLAGTIEVSLKEHISDKTNWRKMLQNIDPDVDLPYEKSRLGQELNDEQQAYLSSENKTHDFTYPVENYPTKVKSVNLLKTDQFEGTLSGIRGQYLIFEDGHVFNVRSHEGFIVDVDVR